MRYGAMLLVVSGAIFVAAGCGGDGSSSESTAVESTSSTVVGDPIEGASTEPVTVPAAGSGTALLTDVRAASHAGYDRVVFEFRNHRPGAFVSYVERPITADGSGTEVAIDGAHVLVVRMEPALDADLTQESAPATYTGPTRFSPDTPAIAELVRIGGFEGVLTWAVGLPARVDFRVLALDDPPRLVLDVRSE